MKVDTVYINVANYCNKFSCMKVDTVYINVANYCNKFSCVKVDTVYINVANYCNKFSCAQILLETCLKVNSTWMIKAHLSLSLRGKSNLLANMEDFENYISRLEYLMRLQYICILCFV